MKTNSCNHYWPFSPLSGNNVADLADEISEKIGRGAITRIDCYEPEDNEDGSLVIGRCETEQKKHYFFEYGSMGLRVFKIRRATYDAIYRNSIFFADNDAEYCYGNHNIIPMEEIR